MPLKENTKGSGKEVGGNGHILDGSTNPRLLSERSSAEVMVPGAFIFVFCLTKTAISGSDTNTFHSDIGYRTDATNGLGQHLAASSVSEEKEASASLGARWFLFSLCLYFFPYCVPLTNNFLPFLRPGGPSIKTVHIKSD